MKLVVDAQLPPALVASLRQLGHDASHVRDIGLREAADAAIWNYAIREGTAILTKDEDFALRRIRSQDGPVVIWVRVGNCSRSALTRWLFPLLATIEQLIADGDTLIELR